MCPIYAELGHYAASIGFRDTNFDMKNMTLKNEKNDRILTEFCRFCSDRILI